MIPDHRHGSVLWTLDAAVRRHTAFVEDSCSAPNGDETARFLQESFDWLQKYLTGNRSPWRSKPIWQLDSLRKVPEGGEEKFAYDLCSGTSGLFRQIPAASGVIDWKGFRNQHANVDLVREISPGDEYELIELKIGSNAAEYAAAQSIRNALLYLIARRLAPDSFRSTRPLLQANRIGLRVWAPAQYYDGYNGQRLQSAISKGFSIFTDGLIQDFVLQTIDKECGKANEVDWETAGAQKRRELRHVPGPFRMWLREKLKDAPKPLLFDSAWRNLITKREHSGFESPDSSQAFGLNIFAPLAHDSELAKKVLNRLLPGTTSAQEKVTIQFEESFEDAAKLLNERGISTQVDVVFTINGAGVKRKLLIEVKLAEEQFGGCKGWFDPKNPPTRNPHRDRCCTVFQNPEAYCYMAAKFSRAYWTYLKPLLPVMPHEPCPFRGSLYQLMRNYLTARLAGPAQFIVCSHPDNDELSMLPLPVCGHYDTSGAVRAFLGRDAVLFWNALDVIEHTAAAEPSLHSWRDWMLDQYFKN